MDKTKLYFTNQTIDREEARQVELRIEEHCQTLSLENPFYDGDAKELDSLQVNGTSDLSSDEICGIDLRKIRESDGLLAYMSNIKDIGSCMEIAICGHSWGKPVYVIATSEEHYNHPWIQYFASQLFHNANEFIQWWKENKEDIK